MTQSFLVFISPFPFLPPPRHVPPNESNLVVNSFFLLLLVENIVYLALGGYAKQWSPEVREIKTRARI